MIQLQELANNLNLWIDQRIAQKRRQKAKQRLNQKRYFRLK